MVLHIRGIICGCQFLVLCNDYLDYIMVPKLILVEDNLILSKNKKGGIFVFVVETCSLIKGSRFHHLKEGSIVATNPMPSYKLDPRF